MFRPRRPTFPFDGELVSRVRVLIFARLALMLVIFLAGWLWVFPDNRHAFDTLPKGMIALLLVSVVLAAIYLLWLSFVRTLVWQIRAQFLIDALIITALVWETGDLISPYITLYIILIAIAGFFLGRSDAYIIAAACSVSFITLGLIIVETTLRSMNGDFAPTRAAQIVGINVAAFLLVGLLSARIADRRKIGEELKQAEANFANLSVLHERILASINSGLITTDLAGNIYAFNDAAEQITGLRTETTIGSSIFTVFGEQIRPHIEECLSGIRTADATRTGVESRIQFPADGNGNVPEITVSCTVSPLVGRSGGVTGLIISFQDRTDYQAMEETLRRSDRLAAVGRLAAGLAHEIRNPLGSMSSALQFLSVKAAPETEDAALMTVILRESDRLNRIISDFLTYARPQPGEETVRGTSEIDARSTVKDCLALLRHDPGVSESHVFEYEPPADPILIRADETQIKQILWNLFQNSIQAMPDGGRLTVSVGEPDEATVRFVVSDNGCGIGPDSIERIFEPFHSERNGTGLGLSIVHRIVTERGGNITVESDTDKGTTFTVDLPK